VAFQVVNLGNRNLLYLGNSNSNIYMSIEHIGCLNFVFYTLKGRLTYQFIQYMGLELGWISLGCKLDLKNKLLRGHMISIALSSRFLYLGYIEKDPSNNSKKKVCEEQTLQPSK
jgi:hypothetical protein